MVRWTQRREEFWKDKRGTFHFPDTHCLLGYLGKAPVGQKNEGAFLQLGRVDKQESII